MKYIVTSSHSLEDTLKKLEENIIKNNFGLLHIHNLREKIHAKNLEFSEESLVLDICNPRIARDILSVDLSHSAIIPCKISLYTQKGDVKIAMLKPTFFFQNVDSTLKEIAKETENILTSIIDNSII